MSTLVLSPAAEMHIIVDQAAAFPATDFTFTDENDNPVDMSSVSAELNVRESTGGAVVLSWKTSDNSMTVEGDDNEILRLNTKTVEQMSITAKKYMYDWFITQPGQEQVRYFYGTLIVRPTGG